MLVRLLLLFTVVPFVELWLLLEIAERIGGVETLGLVILTGFVGAALARREGFRVFWRIQEEMGRGSVPGGAMVDALLVVVAGALLITPGVMTDLVGFSLLIPPVRTWIRRRLWAHFKRRVVVVHHGQVHTPREPEPFVDVEATARDADERDEDHRLKP